MAFKDRMEGTESEVPVRTGQKTDAGRAVSGKAYDGYDDKTAGTSRKKVQLSVSLLLVKFYRKQDYIHTM